MPKKNKKNNYALGPILIAFGLTIGIAALIGDNPIANVVNPIVEPIVKPIADAISGTWPAQNPNPSSPDGAINQPPSDSNVLVPGAGESSTDASGIKQSNPQKTSSQSADLPPSVNSNLPQKVGSAVIYGGGVQKVELSR